jgi:hypothetical protein
MEEAYVNNTNGRSAIRHGGKKRRLKNLQNMYKKKNPSVE